MGQARFEEDDRWKGIASWMICLNDRPYGECAEMAGRFEPLPYPVYFIHPDCAIWADALNEK